jgi:hypothetical protein
MVFHDREFFWAQQRQHGVLPVVRSGTKHNNQNANNDNKQMHMPVN